MNEKDIYFSCCFSLNNSRKSICILTCEWLKIVQLANITIKLKWNQEEKMNVLFHSVVKFTQNIFIKIFWTDIKDKIIIFLGIIPLSTSIQKVWNLMNRHYKCFGPCLKHTLYILYTRIFDMQHKKLEESFLLSLEFDGFIWRSFQFDENRKKLFS